MTATKAPAPKTCLDCTFYRPEEKWCAVERARKPTTAACAKHLTMSIPVAIHYVPYPAALGFVREGKRA